MVKKSFKYKIIIPTVLVFVAMVAVLNVFLSLRFSALSESLIDEQLETNINSLKNYLDTSRVNSEIAAVSLSVNPDAIKAIKEQDKSKILQIFTDSHDLYRINYCTITDNAGKVLARTHEPGNFGDSITNQQNIKDALEGRVASYFEAGTAVKVSVRTGAPVYADGRMIGIISAGVRFDSDEKIDELKRLFHTDMSVFLGDTRVATTIIRDGQRINSSKITPHIGEVVFEKKQEYYGDADIQGEQYKAFYMPLFNARHEPFAAISLLIPETDIIAAINKTRRDGITLGLGGLAIAITLLFIIISSFSKPITRLSDDMHHIAEGDLSVKIDVKGEDEVGQLGSSVLSVANILHKMLDDINIMITEHEKGNTDYFLDTDEFHGDYKKLADNILELSALGMRDHLTGIPNRRSFDNRLDLEWKRAIREKNLISVLILDVDKFKNYNDTYGHQQGDVALQTVAQTLKQSVKRSIDFVARWGGEEFIVLLPSTDSEGAVSVGEHIRKEIENAPIPCSVEGGKRVTVSVGVNTQIPAANNSISSFITIADNALYKAKETGRNRVVSGANDNNS
ncbi:MAG: diguanylate cyclase [Treponema sp.]|jgi:diguanylate cyclase (GGDEF)-like protein|nr:diguanylate cyclase [Treponema sp.]